MLFNLIPSSWPGADLAGSTPGASRQIAPFLLRRGRSPVLVSIPHSGTFIPTRQATRMTDEALELADTSWHLPRLYDFLTSVDATVLTATHSRLVVDLNRPPDNSNLYPGRDATGLIPIETFRHEPVYRNAPPDQADIADRVTSIWRPYHHALSSELLRLRELHDQVVLWSAHSMTSVQPRFFEGRQDDINFGTIDGSACAPAFIEAVLEPVRAQQRFSYSLDGRFKGGMITRSHGLPQAGIHAVQVQVSQRTYMNETSPYDFRSAQASKIATLLKACVMQAERWAGGAR